MEHEINNAQALPLQALKEIPKVKADAKKITALIKDSGTITGYQLSDGSIVSKKQGVELAKQGQIAGVGIATKKETEYLKSLPDETEANNLGNLPSITNPINEQSPH